MTNIRPLMKPTSLTFSQPHYDRLVALATADGVRLSEYVRWIVKRHLDSLSTSGKQLGFIPLSSDDD
jgi:predicted DNA-binding protein